MKLVRYGRPGAEKPGLVDPDGTLRDLSRVVKDITPAVLAPAVGPGVGTASAQDKPVHLKIAHWVPPAHAIHKAMEEWGASIQKATNGTVTYTVFPSQQLGKAFDHYDMVRDGIADVVFINPGYQPGRFPIIDAVNLPEPQWTGGLAALFHRFERYAFGWDAQHDRQLDRLLDLGIDGVYSDHVDRLTAALDRHYPGNEPS